LDLPQESRDFIRTKATADSVANVIPVTNPRPSTKSPVLLDDLIPSRSPDYLEINNTSIDDFSSIINESITNKTTRAEKIPKSHDRLIGISNFELISMFLIALVTSLLFASRQASLIYQVYFWFDICALNLNFKHSYLIQNALLPFFTFELANLVFHVKHLQVKKIYSNNFK
jgi:hypothetical protein